MKIRGKRLLPLGGALAATAILATTLNVPAQASPAYAADLLISSPTEAYGAARFWLEANGAAMRKAKEYTWDAKDVTKLVRSSGDVTDGKPGMVGQSTPKPTKAKNINLPKTIGKVFFVDHKGEYRWCSGTSVQSRYNNLVATAGHCVYDVEGNKDVLDRWVFVPSYYEGKAPHGVFVGKQAVTGYDFDVYEDFDQDYAFVAVYDGFAEPRAREVARTDYTAFTGAKRTYTEEILSIPGGRSAQEIYTEGQSRYGDVYFTKDSRFYRHRYVVGEAKSTGPLAVAAGALGFAWNQKVGEQTVAFGYPGSPHPDGDKPYTGVTPKLCSGKAMEKTYQVNSYKVANHVALKCAMTGGADGGPWVIRYDNGKRYGYVNGVTSVFHDQDGNERVDHISSPYFDGEAHAVYMKANSIKSARIVGEKGELLK
ncbi:hypothetical protein SAMN05421505_13118 [Sinosporangium album]|uniref:V8-like Glu-specific endopeptidase n=1 Tax=Sinosporangium album TaxID=504805 RepID=A0A1G8H8T3_9ACTN|nr:hypothetical protein [Sinosporangium album]SDI02989.1 hypothetical protein SAMN05421505_13118 [Sinosporangium album]